MDIDAVFINDDTAKKIIASSQLKELVSGAVFLCASLETIIATKLHAIRYNNENRNGKDIVDIKILLKENDIESTSEWFTEMCVKFGGPDLYQKYFSSTQEE